jgi:hypothetical protein
MIYPLILRFPDDNGAGSVSTPKSNSQSIKTEGAREVKVPADVAARTFSLETANEGLEQLPPLDPSEGGPAPKTEEVKTESEKKTEKVKVEFEAEKEVKKEEEKEEGVERFLKPPKGSQAEKDAALKKGSKDTFDYAPYSTEETDILKNMPAANRPKVSELFKLAKETANSKTNQFFSHPEGYLLHPGYKTEVATIQRAEAEARIWSQQLRDVKEGVAIKPLINWGQDGKPIYGNEIKVTAENSVELEEAIRNNMNQCMSVASEKRRNVDQFVKNFPQLAQKDFEAIRAERAKRFVWVADPKLLDHTIAMEDGVERSIRQIRNDIAGVFPAYMRNTESVEACGDLMVALILAKSELAEYKKNVKVTSIKKEEESHIEPNSGNPKPKKFREAGPNGVKTFTTDGAGIEIHGA